MKTTRREFLNLSATAVAIGVASCRARGQAQPAPAARTGPGGPYAGAIIDTHQHLWDLSKLRLPWLSGDFKRDYVLKDYLQAAEGLHIAKAVYMEVAVDPEDQAKEARLVLDLCRRREGPTVAAVISGRLESDGFRTYLAEFKADPNLKGLRQIVPAPKGRPELYADKQFVANVRYLGELGLRFDLCMPPTGLTDALALVETCPDTRFVLDHCGNADPKAFAANVDRTSHSPADWRRDMERLARRKNVICKISGIVAQMTPGRWRPGDLAPVIDHCLDSFGPDRCVFASDWPVCTRGASLKEWVNALKEVVSTRPADQQKKLFHDNAAAFYGI